MAVKGQEDQFPPISPRVGCRFGQGTFAGAARKEQDAPTADLTFVRPPPFVAAIHVGLDCC